MGEQADYRPPGWQPGSERAPLDALEPALGTARQGGNAHVRRPGVNGYRPGTSTGTGPSWPAVVATTARLWLQRRRQALGGLFRRHRVIVPAVLAAMALVAGGLAVSSISHATAPAAGDAAA